MSVRMYTGVMDPQEHPDYDRRCVKPIGWNELGNRTRFVALRGFHIQDDRVVDYEETIRKYVDENDLCDVIWPSYPILFADNLGAFIDFLQSKELLLFDIWGYVPGSGPGGYWQQFVPDRETLRMIESRLGSKWLGMDVGEQDGRYVLAYVSQMKYPCADRVEQYLNFQKHIQKICDQLGNKMVTLTAITLGHNELKEGGYTLLGAETAQMHPNAQVLYSYIRGAGKQYGVLWFGNASVYNRWGYKTYGTRDETTDAEADADHGPTKGTSLSLLKRLIYTHILYNCALVGFESGWFEGVQTTDERGKRRTVEGDKLSPIGVIQKSAKEWVSKNGYPGAMVTQVALMSDFYAGWAFPNYNNQLYRVWGNRPYEPCDYFTDGVLDMFYPGYQNSSFFHDETGFLTPTPYGDTVDCILSDAEQWLLDRYPILVVTGELSGDDEIRDKLETYARNGGHLVISSGCVSRFSEGFLGITVRGELLSHPAGTEVRIGDQLIIEDHPFELMVVDVPDGSNVLASCGNIPAVVEFRYGTGTVTVLAAPYGVCSEPAVDLPVTCSIDRPLPKPYPLLRHVRTALDRVFRSQVLFTAGEGLSVVVCRKEAGRYTIGISNNTWEDREFKIESRVGRLRTVRELTLDQTEKTCAGYLPEGVTRLSNGAGGENCITGGDIRIFSIEVEEENVESIPHTTPSSRPKGRALSVEVMRSIKDEILRRPTFFEHFDSMVVDWEYVHRSEESWLRADGEWVKRQGLRVIVDLSSGMNLFPDLRLVNNDHEEYLTSRRTIDQVVKRMGLIGSKDLVLRLHRAPENNFTYDQTYESLVNTIREICETAETLGITVYLRTGKSDPAALDLASLRPQHSNFHDMSVADLVAFIRTVDSNNLKLAISMAMVLVARKSGIDVVKGAEDEIGMWLISAPRWDITGRLWSINSPLTTYQDESEVMQVLRSIHGQPMVLDVPYKSWNETYEDVRLIDRHTRQCITDSVDCKRS